MSLIVNLPLALDGESVTGNSTGLAVISLISMVLGYAGLFALWWFFFRDRSRTKRKRKSSD
jgi:hypothetical protein